jgi:hypothetical protein
MRDNNPKNSQHGDGCHYYEPSYDSSRIL